MRKEQGSEQLVGKRLSQCHRAEVDSRRATVIQHFRYQRANFFCAVPSAEHSETGEFYERDGGVMIASSRNQSVNDMDGTSPGCGYIELSASIMTVFSAMGSIAAMERITRGRSAASISFESFTAGFILANRLPPSRIGSFPSRYLLKTELACPMRPGCFARVVAIYFAQERRSRCFIGARGQGATPFPWRYSPTRITKASICAWRNLLRVSSSFCRFVIGPTRTRCHVSLSMVTF